MNALKCRTLGIYNVRARMLESARAIEAGSVHCCKHYSFDFHAITLERSEKNFDLRPAQYK